MARPNQYPMCAGPFAFALGCWWQASLPSRLPSTYPAVALLPSASMTIEVVDYDEAWPSRAAVACAELRGSLLQLFTAIEHIGSTAVPGLAAKPVIDLMASTADVDQVTEHDTTLRLLGYKCHETGMSGRLFYLRDENGKRAYHLHVVSIDSWPGRNELLLRDYLRTHPADAQRYGKLKRSLATRHETPVDYTQAKTALIQELTDRARTAG